MRNTINSEEIEKGNNVPKITTIKAKLNERK
jgi:hypothetical protein